MLALFLALFLTPIPTASADAEPACNKRHVSVLIKELNDEVKLVRLDLIDHMNQSDTKSADEHAAKVNMLIDKMNTLDKRNQVELNKVVEKCGWPTGKEYDSKTINAAFYIVQHADLDFQQKYYQDVRRAYDAGDIPGALFAMFEDRVLIRLGKRQRYGTQSSAEKGASFKLDPIEDPQNVNARRKLMGLPPLNEAVLSEMMP
ncbi:MAG: hypothetical protein JNM52_07135 [Betaproteobacteria bacterium]|nr:hypothetical protein [Betaproteobacteria bacterium]